MTLPAVVFRDMTASDAAEAAAIEKISTLSPWSEEAFRVELRNPAARCRAVTVAGRLAAFLVAWHIPGETQAAELAVHPDFRRRGLARALVREMLVDASAHGSALATLETRESNIPARRLYESFGFFETGRRRAYYEDREDAILMEKRL